MQKSRLFVLICAGVFTGLAAQAQDATVTQTTYPSGAVITNYEAKGNLAVTHELDCIPLSEVKNTYTPPDLYRAYAKCAQKEDYKDATDLFMIAGAYARFDALRVADKTAHQARAVLIMNNSSILSEKQKNEWNAYSKKYTPESQEVADVCKQAKRIGAPDYYPTYMIQHGIQAFSKEKTDPIVSDFNPQGTWQIILDNGLHCN